MAFYS